MNLFKSDTVLSVPFFPAHKRNYVLIKSHSADSLAWSLFCASRIAPKYDTPRFPPPTDVSASNLVAKADSPPAWTDKYRSVPLIGNYLNVMSQAASYGAELESCADFMAADLEKGLASEWIGKRVAVMEKSKVH